MNGRHGMRGFHSDIEAVYNGIPVFFLTFLMWWPKILMIIANDSRFVLWLKLYFHNKKYYSQCARLMYSSLFPDFLYFFEYTYDKYKLVILLHVSYYSREALKYDDTWHTELIIIKLEFIWWNKLARANKHLLIHWIPVYWARVMHQTLHLDQETVDYKTTVDKESYNE